MSPQELDAKLEAVVAALAKTHGSVVFITGAGISAESGLPTFRGREGHWEVRSRTYQAAEMATRAAFDRMPEEVWLWHLYRRGLCVAAQPNAAHRALAELELNLGDRLRVITQNVDGLHLRAGNRPDRVYQVHGNINGMLCAAGCPGIVPIPTLVGLRGRADRLSDSERAALACAKCGSRARPFVRFVDENYDEESFRADSALAAAGQASLVVTVGSSGSMELCVEAATLAARRGAFLVDINPEPNPFAQLASHGPCGVWLQGSACAQLPRLVDRLRRRSASEHQRRWVPFPECALRQT